MNYIGSKLSLLPFLEESISKVVDKKCHTFCDLFAGTGIVGIHFKKKGYQVVSNDIQYYSYVLNRHYVGNHRELKFKTLEKEMPALKNIELTKRKKFVCDFLAKLPGRAGFIYKNYCLGGTKNKKNWRQYFSDENGQRCDAIRQQIENWKKHKLVSDDEYYFLLASLLNSIDKYANTASVYGAFLKKLKRTARNNLDLQPAELVINEQDHQIFNTDVNNLVDTMEGDILYLDPPYNHRQYASNYHLLETIARYDDPVIYGKTGLRNDYEQQKSLYCSRPKVKAAFQDLIMKAKVKYIFLSYNNEGLLALEDIKNVLSLRGKYGFFTREHNRFRADKAKNRKYSANKTTEYLHYVVCK